MSSRSEHIKLGDKMVKEGKMLFGAALTDDNNKMIGSILICDFENREELDQWLKIEPYVTGKVWEKIDVQLCKIGPSFEHMFK
jgi:uncharacterized protein YciI